MKNGYYWAGAGEVRSIGWGDVSFGDLDAVSEALGAGEVLVVLPERAVHPIAAPEPVTARSLADYAVYAVISGRVLWVDRHRQANRQGGVWIRPGHRVANTGRTIRRRARRVLVPRPDELLASLQHLDGPGPTATTGSG